MVAALDLGSSVVRRGGSSPPLRTQNGFNWLIIRGCLLFRSNIGLTFPKISEKNAIFVVHYYQFKTDNIFLTKKCGGCETSTLCFYPTFRHKKALQPITGESAKITMIEK
jgi:hypothetical protein